MKKIFLFFIIISSVQIFAQMPDFKKTVQDSMQQVSIMIGKWEGKGWQMNQKGEKSNSNVDENIQWKLDSTLILMEGIGKSDNGNIAHNALGLLSFDPFNKKFEFNSHLANGLETTASFEVIKPNEKFKWWFNDNRGGTIRYSISINSNKWNEEGEYSQDGTQWNKFFEMNLERID